LDVGELVDFCGAPVGSITSGLTGDLVGLTGKFVGGLTGEFVGGLTGEFVGGLTGAFVGGLTGAIVRGFTGASVGRGPFNKFG